MYNTNYKCVKPFDVWLDAATLKIPDDCPTSYNDYIVTFHRNLLPKEVKVTEYGIDGSSKVML